MRRIPAFLLVALLVAAPAATCLVAVRAHAGMATDMAAGDDCGASGSEDSPAFCAARMVAASAPTGVPMAPSTFVPAGYGAMPTPNTASYLGNPVPDTGPPGSRPPAWLRHSAFLI